MLPSGVNKKRVRLSRALLCVLIVLSLLCAGPGHAALHADHAIGSDCAACLFATLEVPTTCTVLPAPQRGCLPPAVRQGPAPDCMVVRAENARAPPR